MTAAVEVTTNEELIDLVATERYLVINFGAPAWCVPCQRLAPVYEKIAGKIPEAKFVHVDIEKADQRIRESWGIQSVPTVVMFAGNSQSFLTNHAPIPLMKEIQEKIDADANAN